MSGRSGTLRGGRQAVANVFGGDGSWSWARVLWLPGRGLRWPARGICSINRRGRKQHGVQSDYREGAKNGAAWQKLVERLLQEHKPREAFISLIRELRGAFRAMAGNLADRKIVLLAKGFAAFTTRYPLPTLTSPKITYDAGRFHVLNAHWHPASAAKLVYCRAPKQYLNPPRRNTD